MATQETTCQQFAECESKATVALSLPGGDEVPMCTKHQKEAELTAIVAGVKLTVRNL